MYKCMGKPKSAIFDHYVETTHAINKSAFQIIRHCSLSDNIEVMEAIYIYLKKPSMNIQRAATQLSVLII